MKFIAFIIFCLLFSLNSSSQNIQQSTLNCPFTYNRYIEPTIRDVKGDGLILELRSESITLSNLPNLITPIRNYVVNNLDVSASMIKFAFNSNNKVTGFLNRYTGELSLSEQDESLSQYKWFLQAKCSVTQRLF